MSLSGALESFPVVEVLKLAGKTAKTGVLRVDAQGLEARIYLVGGALTYATTRRDEEFHSRLVEAGLVDPKAWVDVERRERSIMDILRGGATPDQLSEFMLDQVSDVLFRVLRESSGRFAFSDDVAARFDTGVLLDVDVCVTEAQQRLDRWREIETVIPGVGFHLSLRPGAGDDQPISLENLEWRVLASFTGSGSVEECARKLGMSEFRTAELMAGMVRAGLLAVADGRPDGRYTYGEADADTPEESSDEERPTIEVLSTDKDAVDDDEDQEVLRSALSDIVAPEEPPSLKRRKGLQELLREAE